MGKKNDLSAAEKRQIMQCLGEGDHRTVKRFVVDSEHRWVRADKGIMSKVTARYIHHIKRAAVKMPLQSSKQVFEAAGTRTSRCRILQRFAVVHKPTIRPTNAHKQKWLQWPINT